jgi:hypothetical protein
MKGALAPSFSFFLFFALILAGCQQKNWIFYKTLSDCPKFNSTQLRYAATNSFSGIEVLFLKGDFGMVSYLSVCSRFLLSSTMSFQIAGTLYVYSGVILEGGQRMLLPKEATETLIRALLSGQNVSIDLEGFHTELCPLNFSKKYKKFIG